MKWRLFAVAVTCMTAMLSSVPAQATTGPVVQTEDGAIRGTAGSGYRSFAGIPYAAPPVGALRWVAPQPVPSWPGIRDAGQPGSPCPQMAGVVPGGSTNEDCLYLNVTAPDTARPARPKPVIVWVHGGAFVIDTGSSYDPRRLATRGDVVVVTINYRLGALGFLGHAGLPGSGTFGLADQQAALRWVRANIAAFGGDTNNVTLAGESAGAFSVCAQLASPSAAGLFDRAIIESGPCTGRPERPFAPSAASIDTVDKTGAKLAADVGCGAAPNVMGCLRATEVSRLLSAQADVQPAYGTPLLPQTPGAALAAGRFNRVPVLIGNNHDEGNFWAGLAISQGDTVTHENWPETVASFFPRASQAAAITREYPVPGSDGGPVFGALIGDWNFACPTIRSSEILHPRVLAWEYEFADEHAPSIAPFPPPFPLGAAHGSELPYLFDLLGMPIRMTAAQHRLADTMIGYWSRFARTGDPNGLSSPRWRAGAVQSLAPDHIGPRNIARQHHCALWDTMP